MYKVLGWLGLVPFVLLAIAAELPVPVNAQTAAFLFICYSSIILSFLSGTYWERVRQLDVNPAGLIVSNVFALLAGFALMTSLLHLGLSLGILAASYLAFLIIELKSTAPIKEEAYASMRIRISIAVIACHLFLMAGNWVS